MILCEEPAQRSQHEHMDAKRMLPDVQSVVFIQVITFSTFSHQASLNSSQHHLDSTSKSKEGELVAGGGAGGGSDTTDPGVSRTHPSDLSFQWPMPLWSGN